MNSVLLISSFPTQLRYLNQDQERATQNPPVAFPTQSSHFPFQLPLQPHKKNPKPYSCLSLRDDSLTDVLRGT